MNGNKVPVIEKLDASIPMQDITKVVIKGGIDWIGIWDDPKIYEECGGIPSYLTEYVCSNGNGVCGTGGICKFDEFFIVFFSNFDRIHPNQMTVATMDTPK